VCVCVCVSVASGTQHAKRTRHIAICSLPHSTIFSRIISQKARFSIKLLSAKCITIFSTTFVWNISHSKKNWARCDQNVWWSSCKVSFILVRFEWKMNFLDSFFFLKIPKWQISRKSVQWEPSCSMRTDMTKIVAYRNFPKAPEKV